MAGGDLTIEILKDTREEIRATNQRLDATNQRLDVSIDRLDVSIARLDVTNSRFDTVESTLLDLVEQQRLVVHYARALSERDARLERRVDELAIRVERLETK